MKERIKELAEQAGIYQLDRFDAIDGSNQMEKFAELIVRECANMLDEDSYLMPELGGYAHDMRQRFGVKDV
jgi:hypothetical protein